MAMETNSSFPSCVLFLVPDNKLCYSQVWDTIHVSNQEQLLFRGAYSCVSGITHSRQFCLFPRVVKCLFSNNWNRDMWFHKNQMLFVVSNIHANILCRKHTYIVGSCFDIKVHKAYFAKYQTFFSHFFVKIY